MFLTCEIARYVEYLKAKGHAETTIRSYQYNLKRFKQYVQSLGITGIGEFNREVMFNYQLHLASHQPMLSISVRTNNLLAVKSFIKYLTKSNQLMANFAAEVEFPKQKHQLPKGIMSVREIKKLLNQPDTKTHLGLRDKAILELLYASGIRNSELRALKINDINFKEKIIYVNNGKGGRDRIVPFGKIVHDCLEVYIQKSRRRFLRDSAEQTLFMGYGKRSLSNEAVSDMVRKYVKQAGIKKRITPHSIRHTFATHMLKRNQRSKTCLSKIPSPRPGITCTISKNTFNTLTLKLTPPEQLRAMKEPLLSWDGGVKRRNNKSQHKI